MITEFCFILLTITLPFRWVREKTTTTFAFVKTWEVDAGIVMTTRK